MTYYRLYLMHPLSGHIAEFKELVADSDTDALRVAEEQRGTATAELWCMGRKIHRWEARTPVPPSQNCSASRPS